MPDPADYKDQESFIKACIPIVKGEGGKTMDQVLGKCYGMWANKKKKKKASIDVDKLMETLTKSGKPSVFLGGTCDDNNAWRKNVIKEFGSRLTLIDPYDEEWSSDNIYGELALILKVENVIFYKGGSGTKNEKEFLDKSDKKYKSFEDLGELKEYLKSLVKMKKCASDVLRSIVAKLGAKYKSCNTQVPLPEGLSNSILAWGKANIPTKDLYDDEDKDKGLENDIHITLLYGLESEDIDKVREVLKNVQPFEVRLGLIDAFKDDKKHDVLKVNIEAPMLIKLHYLIEKTCNVETKYPTFHAHCTIGYCKKDKANKYIGDETFKGQTFMADTIIFSDKSGEHIPIHLR